MSITVLDPLLSEADAADVVRVWHDHPGYGQYSNEGFATTYAPELSQRYDASVNFVRSGGRFGRKEERSLLQARTNYFRETYAYGDEVFAPGIEAFRDSPALEGAARKLHGRDVIVAAIVYANILLPGQELAVHTDVPEFRGANRKILPQWLLVVMRHSELFERWRMPIATGIAYFGHARGGELAYYPAGANGPAVTYAPAHNTAALLDTDTIFHGVDRVAGDDSVLATLRPGMHMRHVGSEQWVLEDPTGARVASFATDDLRYSVSWKAYCFADAGQRDAWASHDDDLELDQILTTLEADMRRRGVLDGEQPCPADFGRQLIATYITFPAPEASAS